MHQDERNRHLGIAFAPELGTICLDVNTFDVLRSTSPQAFSFTPLFRFVFMENPLPRIISARSSSTVLLAVALLLTSCFSSVTFAQNDDAFGDAADPVRLFERGQNAHARNDLDKAL